MYVCVCVCLFVCRKHNLKVREHSILGPYVDGLSTLAVSSFKVAWHHTRRPVSSAHCVSVLACLRATSLTVYMRLRLLCWE